MEFVEQVSLQPAAEPESLRVRMVAEARQTFGIRAAGQLWLKLQLPIVPAMLEGASQAELFDRMKTIDHTG